MPRVPRIASRISAVVALTGLSACSPSDSGIQVPGFSPGAAVAVIVSPSSASVRVGLTLQMTATLVDDAGNELSGDVSWASSNTNVASVSELGLVTGVSAGAVTITATSGTISGGAPVIIMDSGPPTT